MELVNWMIMNEWVCYFRENHLRSEISIPRQQLVKRCTYLGVEVIGTVPSTPRKRCTAVILCTLILQLEGGIGLWHMEIFQLEGEVTQLVSWINLYCNFKKLWNPLSEEYFLLPMKLIVCMYQQMIVHRQEFMCMQLMTSWKQMWKFCMKSYYWVGINSGDI